MRTPFNEVSVVGNELRYVAEAAASLHLAGDGPFSDRCAEHLASHFGARVLMTPSCTHALEMCAYLLGLEPGDEVVVPSYAFVTTASAFAAHGATPVFADVCPDTWNLDPDDVARRIGPRTRAIVALHYGGVACDLEALGKLAERSGCMLIEDNAHGLYGAYRGRPLGSFGALATLSFHETKNLTCGEGGALVVNDPQLASRAEIIRDKGTDRARFRRGEVDRYTWRDNGSSYLLSELQAAFLYGQLEAAERVMARRRAIWTRYRDELRDWAETRGVALQHVPDESDPPYHLFPLLLPDEGQRDALIAHLARAGVLGVFHYLPLHLSPVGRRYGGTPGDCPVSEDVSRRLVRLPMFFGLDSERQSEVIGAVRTFGAAGKSGGPRA
ncbi:MAG: dTDP-4-amino-4,6-dideoxygalactose transaminase [Myxococcota bacterium]|nr:dTDP-4-amino-4,6-dideoxygalactose transaminase [Myxococcota bacterium]